MRKKDFLTILGALWHFFQNFLYLPNNPIGQLTHLLLNILTVRIHGISGQSDKSCKKVKNWYFLVLILAFFSFGNCVCFSKKASQTTNFFLVERLHFSKPPSFSEKRQKLQKFFQFRSEFDAFFETNCIFLFEEASWTTNFFLVERF